MLYKSSQITWCEQQQILASFYRAIIESILSTNTLVWFCRVSQRDIRKLPAVVRNAELIIGTGLTSDHSLHKDHLRKMVGDIIEKVS